MEKQQYYDAGWAQFFRSIRLRDFPNALKFKPLVKKVTKMSIGQGFFKTFLLFCSLKKEHQIMKITYYRTV